MNTGKLAASGLSSRPLYLQLRAALVERIAGGTWKPGAPIPNEADLAREFGVSAGTMRKALDLLERERLITRQQGRGTFVNDQSSDALSQRFINLRGPDGERLLGNVRSVTVTDGVANEIERNRLDLAADDRVYRIRRVRVIDERPFLFVEASLPASLFPGLDRMDGDGRIVGLALKHGLLLGKAEERVTIGGASPPVAEALDIAPGSAIARLDRVVRSTDGVPVEWRVAWCELAENHYLVVMD